MKFTVGTRYFRLALCLVAVIAAAVVSGVPTRTVRAAFPGTNGQISFTLFNPAIGSGQIWVSNPDGSKQVQVTTLPSAFSDWSPDGSKIAFDFFDGQTNQIGTIRFVWQIGRAHV